MEVDEADLTMEYDALQAEEHSTQEAHR